MAISRAHADIAAIWATEPEDFGIDRTSSGRTRLMLTVFSGLPRDWKLTLAADRITANIPSSYWKELAEITSISSLNIEMVNNAERSGGYLTRVSPLHYTITVPLPSISVAAMLTPDGLLYFQTLIAHELAHIAHYGDEEPVDYRIPSPLYYFTAHEIVAYAASVAIDWVETGNTGPFSLSECVRTASTWNRRAAASFALFPLELPVVLRNRTLAYWQRCFVRLCRFHIAAYRVSKVLCGNEASLHA